MPQGALFDPALQGSIAASQGDLWFLNWEGNPTRLESRSHPMGVVVETRALGWNFPQGNEDIIYFLYTFYNITSTNEADYAAVRPSLRPILLEQAATFQATNAARFGINLPAGGYAINDLFAAFVADMDVAQADANYAAVNVPFALGVTYENTFSNGASLGWTFPPAIFGSAPFFPGIGFIGVKYLGSPLNPDTQEPVGLTLFGTFSRSSGSLQDPGDEKQLYRYITGGLLPTDGACSLTNPLESKICFVNISSPADMRFFQSSGPIDLPPGGVRHHRGGLHLRRAGVCRRLPGRRLRREAGGHQRRPHHPGRSRPDGQRREQARHHDGVPGQHQRRRGGSSTRPG